MFWGRTLDYAGTRWDLVASCLGSLMEIPRPTRVFRGKRIEDLFDCLGRQDHEPMLWSVAVRTDR